MGTKIYVLLDEKSVIRYVGKTARNLAGRLSNHISCAYTERSSHRTNWIKKCLSEGYRPAIRLLEEVNGDGCQEEIYWIRFFRESGFNLVNGTDGGEGKLGYKCLPETKAKISLAEKGKINSPEARAKMSLARMGHSCSMETRAKLSQASKGKKTFLGRSHSEETKIKMSAARRKWWERNYERRANSPTP